MRKPTIPDVPKNFWEFHQWQIKRAILPVDKVAIWMINLVKKKGTPFEGPCDVTMSIDSDRGRTASITVFTRNRENRHFTLYDFKSKEYAEKYMAFIEELFSKKYKSLEEADTAYNDI